jgi:hypothetical protein
MKASRNRTHHHANVSNYWILAGGGAFNVAQSYFVIIVLRRSAKLRHGGSTTPVASTHPRKRIKNFCVFILLTRY